jgi:cardiolipin synthase
MSKWVPGNHFTLLENGEEFFPRVFDSIDAAREQVVLETFIMFEDKVGTAQHCTRTCCRQRRAACKST